MSDSLPSSKTAIYEHWCCIPGCGKWGGFGFDRIENRMKTTTWWCWEHYPYKDPYSGRIPRDAGS